MVELKNKKNKRKTEHFKHFFLFLHSILSLTAVSEGAVMLLLVATHLRRPEVCFLSKFLIVSVFFTVPS